MLDLQAAVEEAQVCASGHSSCMQRRLAVFDLLLKSETVLLFLLVSWRLWWQAVLRKRDRQLAEVEGANTVAQMQLAGLQENVQQLQEKLAAEKVHLKHIQFATPFLGWEPTENNILVQASGMDPASSQKASSDNEAATAMAENAARHADTAERLASAERELQQYKDSISARDAELAAARVEAGEQQRAATQALAELVALKKTLEATVGKADGHFQALQEISAQAEVVLLPLRLSASGPA